MNRETIITRIVLVCCAIAAALSTYGLFIALNDQQFFTCSVGLFIAAGGTLWAVRGDGKGGDRA
jgi:hypothetical protein